MLQAGPFGPRAMRGVLAAHVPSAVEAYTLHTRGSPQVGAEQEHFIWQVAILNQPYFQSKDPIRFLPLNIQVYLTVLTTARACQLVAGLALFTQL